MVSKQNIRQGKKGRWEGFGGHCIPLLIEDRINETALSRAGNTDHTDNEASWFGPLLHLLNLLEPLGYLRISSSMGRQGLLEVLKKANTDLDTGYCVLTNCD